MQSQKTLLSLLALAAVATFAGCAKKAEGQSTPQPPGRGRNLPVPVSATAAARKNVPLLLQAIGTARAYASVSIKARVDGQLARVNFKQGEEVEKGAQIFQIDPRPFQTALDQAKAVLARDTASLQNAEIDMRRTDQLASTKAVSASTVDANRAKVASLRATVEADNAAIASANLQLSYCSIASPVSGRVGLLMVDEGNMVKNNDTILAVINQTRPIYVDFAVPEQRLGQVREAARAKRLKIEAVAPQNAAPATGELEVINNQVDSATGTLLLRGVFPNADERLWPGQFLNVTLTLGELNDAVVVPSQAVQTSQSGEFVFVVKADATVEKRSVTLGPVRDGEVVIQSGVQPGETVVTDGQLRLAPGSKVEVKAPVEAPANQQAPPPRASGTTRQPRFA